MEKIHVFINNFGQRNFVKFLLIISFVMSFLGYWKIQMNTNIGFLSYFIQPMVLFGLFLFNFSSIMFLLGALKSRSFRYLCIYGSLLTLIFNSICFFGNFYDILFPLTIIECFGSFILFIFILWKEKQSPKNKIIKKSNKTTTDKADKKDSGLKI